MNIYKTKYGLVKAKLKLYGKRMRQGSVKAVDDAESMTKQSAPKSNDDFRSHECLELLKECDVVVTNPPFSLMKEYLPLMLNSGKQFLVLGNINHITFREIFSYKYVLPVSIQRNCAFKSLIYLVEQKQAGSYNTSYSIELNNDIPYIIESSVEAEKIGLAYAAETTEDFYFVFCSSENPTSTVPCYNSRSYAKTL